MLSIENYSKYLPIISKSNLFNGIPTELYPKVFDFLHATIRTYQKDEIIQMLGEPFLYSGIVLDGTVEGSFTNEEFNKINMNHFTAGRSYGEALACVKTPHSPIQLSAVTECTILHLDLSQILNGTSCDCSYHRPLTTNLLKALSTQNIFSNLKLRIASQKSLRDRILIYLYSLMPDTDGFLHVPFNQTALAEFLGVNRSALSRELGRMQDEGIILVEKKAVKLL